METKSKLHLSPLQSPWSLFCVGHHSWGRGLPWCLIDMSSKTPLEEADFPLPVGVNSPLGDPTSVLLLVLGPLWLESLRSMRAIVCKFICTSVLLNLEIFLPLWFFCLPPSVAWKLFFLILLVLWNFCTINFDHIQPLPNLSQNQPLFPAYPTLWPLKNKTERKEHTEANLCCPYILGYVTFHWSVVDLPVLTNIHKETWLTSFRFSCQLPLAPRHRWSFRLGFALVHPIKQN